MRKYILAICFCSQIIICNAFDGIKLGFQINPSFTTLPNGAVQLSDPHYRRDILSYTPSPISLMFGLNAKASFKNNFSVYANLLFSGSGYSSSEKVNVPLTTGEFYTKVSYWVLKPQFLLGYNIIQSNNKQLCTIYAGLDVNFNVMSRIFNAYTINTSDTPILEVLSEGITKEILKINFSGVVGVRKTYQTAKRTIELGISYHHSFGYSNTIEGNKIMNKYSSHYIISPKLNQISFDIIFYRKNKTHKKLRE